MTEKPLKRFHIVFVDDEQFFAKRYLEELEPLFNIHYIDNVDSALEYLKGDHAIDAVVLDIMMPPPIGNANVAVEKQNTGLWLLGKIKEFRDPWDLPVFILTNRSPTVVHETIKRLQLPKHYLEVRHKVDTAAAKLPILLGSFIKKIYNL